MNKKTVISIIIGVILAIFVGTGTGFYLYLRSQEKILPVISHESGIYSDTLYISFEHAKFSRVYYSVNGESQKEYTEPIVLEMWEGVSSYSLQYYCEYWSKKVTEVYNKEFMLSPQGTERFTTDYVVSIKGDSDELFSDEKGLMVRGTQFYDYLEANPDVDLLTALVPANYFSNRQIGVHTVIFDSAGTELINQNCGFKIYGNITRAKNQKSIRLTADKDYDAENKKFKYAFLPQLQGKDGEPIGEYKKLSLHNSGNDNGYGFIRNTLIGRLAGEAGFPDVIQAKSATLFINDKYEGVYWLENTFDQTYFKEKYGDFPGRMAVCEGSLNQMDLKNADNAEEEKAANLYNEFMQWVQNADFSREEDWEKLEKTIDIQNFVRYFAIEYYVDNLDWPTNNVKVYRYIDPNDNYTDGTVFDGRFRYILFDTDYGMGLQFMGFLGYEYWYERLVEFYEGDNALLFKKLVLTERFREMFAEEVNRLMENAFKAENVEKALTELNASRIAELTYMMQETDLLKNSLWESDDNSIENVEYEMDVILDFAKNRPLTVYNELAELEENKGVAE